MTAPATHAPTAFGADILFLPNGGGYRITRKTKKSVYVRGYVETDPGNFIIGDEIGWGEKERRLDRATLESAGVVKLAGVTLLTKDALERWNRPRLSARLDAALRLLGIQPCRWGTLSIIDVNGAYRSSAACAHPDRGGNAETFRAVAAARDVVLSALQTWVEAQI